VSLGYNASLSKGLYTLYITNNRPTPAFVYFDYQLVPDYVNPYLISLHHSLPPAPTGIAAFGIYNDSGKITPYTAEGSSVIGFVNISSMIAINPNDTQDGRANLQMNSVLQVRNSDNASFVYWPQNVMWFATNDLAASRQVLYRNNIFNMTGD
jgi:thermopsin